MTDTVFSSGRFNVSTELGSTYDNTHSLLLLLLQRVAQAGSHRVSIQKFSERDRPEAI